MRSTKIIDIRGQEKDEHPPHLHPHPADKRVLQREEPRATFNSTFTIDNIEVPYYCSQGRIMRLDHHFRVDPVRGGCKGIEH